MGTSAYERGKVQMLPSVLIATMGGGRLEEVVRTYLHDRAAAVEVVVIVDNPSINREAFLLSLPSDARLNLAFNEVNMGLTKSLNKGLELCHGDIVLRNDDDDLPHPERLAKTVAYFRDHPDCDLAYTFTRGIDANSADLDNTRPHVRPGNQGTSASAEYHRTLVAGVTHGASEGPRRVRCNLPLRAGL